MRKRRTLMALLLLGGLVAHAMIDARSAAAQVNLKPNVFNVPTHGSLTGVIKIPTEVLNEGATGSGPYHVAYMLSADGVLDASDRLIKSVAMDPLGTKASVSWDQYIEVPDGLVQDQYYIAVAVDPTDRVGEIHEDDNTSIEQIELLMGLPINICPSVDQVGTPYVAGVNCRTWLQDGYTRTYIVYVPPVVLDSLEGGSDFPLVIMHHGSSGHGARFLKISGWRELADRMALVGEGLIVVFPTGMMYCKVGKPCETGGLMGWTTKWHSYDLTSQADLNFGVRPPGYDPVAPFPVDDIEFEKEILSDLDSHLPVDPLRMYATGFSNGGSFTHRLSLELPERFAAAAWSGSVWSLPNALPAERIPMFVTIGTDDPGFMDVMGVLPDPIPLDPFEFLQNSWITGNGNLAGYVNGILALDSEPDLAYTDPISTLLIWATPTAGTPQGKSFQLALLKDLAHVYPNGTNNPHGFEAAATFWDFFKLRHR